MIAWIVHGVLEVGVVDGVDAAATAISSTAFTSYKEHAKNQHAKAVNQKEIKEILKQKRYPSKRMKHANVFVGFSIKPLQ